MPPHNLCHPASDTIDTSNTANSSDASKTSASVNRLSSYFHSFPIRQRSLDSFILLKFSLSREVKEWTEIISFKISKIVSPQECEDIIRKGNILLLNLSMINA